MGQVVAKGAQSNQILFRKPEIRSCWAVEVISGQGGLQEGPRHMPGRNCTRAVSACLGFSTTSASESLSLSLSFLAPLSLSLLVRQKGTSLECMGSS